VLNDLIVGCKKSSQGVEVCEYMGRVFMLGFVNVHNGSVEGQGVHCDLLCALDND
jgi:hypothetical protein